MPILIGETQPDVQDLDMLETDEETPRRRDPEATRQAILEAAEELFVCHGPSATSLSQIARAANITKSLIHHHFGSKEELFAEVQQRHFQEYFEAQKEMLESSDSTSSLLEDSLITYFRFLQSHPESVRFMMWSTVEGGDDGCPKKAEKGLFELGIQKIREAQERGEIRADLEPFFIIKTLLALPMAWFQSRAETLQLVDSEIEPEALDELYLRDMIAIFLEGVRPRPTDADPQSPDRQSPDRQTSSSPD
ncbi:MAG: TetR/AcrR family transcriptional regulator [Acidobacteriota bacterium]